MEASYTQSKNKGIPKASKDVVQTRAENELSVDGKEGNMRAGDSVSTNENQQLNHEPAKNDMNEQTGDNKTYLQNNTLPAVEINQEHEKEGEHTGESLISDEAKMQEDAGAANSSQDTEESMVSNIDEVGVKFKPPDDPDINSQRDIQEDAGDIPSQHENNVVAIISSGSTNNQAGDKGSNKKQMAAQSTNISPNTKLQEIVAHKMSQTKVQMALEEAK
ncbi:hypothetical protein K7X08_014733 [Anisodus acutangulus]|uniref:Uncharacterized protein n=1 Tax=Anisodus acutangulus TaxID=402998 RepID=A0A9Q1R2M7_9SOLA|nr:hypothetical protein K7X08_014733 [Anisodus acutangulus]